MKYRLQGKRTPRMKREARVTPELLLLNPRATFVRALWYDALDWLFPPTCALCQRVDYGLCSRCANALPVLNRRVLHRVPPLIDAISTGEHTGKLRHVVRVMKYGSDAAVAQRIAHALGARLHAALSMSGWQIDLVIPVPLHIQRQKQRGFNQAALLSAALCNFTDERCIPSAIERTRATASQVGLNIHQRQQNMRGAFQADRAIIEDQRVLLIDDVFTTGATLAACADALIAAGAHSVYALTVTSARGAP
jgi:ComF family protein